MAQVLVHGLEAVLMAAKLALEACKPSGEHVLNVRAMLESPAEVMALEPASTKVKMALEPQANVQRYDRLPHPCGEAQP